MVLYPPNFMSKLAEEKWNEGFKAGVQEVIHALKEQSTDGAGAPNEQWVRDFSEKLEKKYS
jgi:hypothetical protein